ncbi:hypothetical protein BJX68DRAFT_274188 [Aspergillus pseudodeflectus]|uniref:Uncharacterized protein n=1 Tax=Aspergillus pseudodeflectus TaxID=176178 RepID=A0ABR4KSI6_9EURO
MDVHVVSKSNNANHATFSLPPPTAPLPASSIRVRASLLSLSSNNLTYALLGDMLHWWDTYPVPDNAPAPYNDRAAWGIVPAWGFATVLESTIPEIASGTKIWGYWPASAHVVDLTLSKNKDDPETHWIETSAHRTSLLPLYNRYIISTSADETRHAWESAVRPIWQCGYVLSEYVFTPDPSVNPAIHPLPGAPSVKPEWTNEDADISKTVVISLAASSKTGRSAAHNFACRPAGSGPLGLLQVTSSPEAIGSAAEALKPQFATRAVGYTQLSQPDVGQWIASLSPSKIVIVDFGSRDGGFDAVHSLIRSHDALAKTDLVILAVGFQQKVYTLADVAAAQAAAGAHGIIQLNTSPILSAALEVQGARKVYEGLEERWEHWLANREVAAPDLRLVWGEGITGEQGIEGGWDRLCQGGVRPEEALVYRL